MIRYRDKLRPYQAGLVQEVEVALAEHRSVLLQLPTGGGKTHIAVEVAKRATARSGRVWFICHRREILKQTSAAFEAGGVAHGIVSAESVPNWKRMAQICSIGSMARRLDLAGTPDLIIWDECHHVAAKSWAKLRAAFPNAAHLGLTATPARLDGRGLGEWFAHLICGPTTRALIDQGFLSDYRLFAPTIPDLRGVGMSMGDYDKRDLDRAMNRPVLVGDVVDHYKRITPDARAIVFASSVAASEAVAAKFRAAGVPAAHIEAKTPIAERDAAVAALASGALKVLCNVELFTEGFDLPAIDAVILLRPTRSLALYHQMVGRGLRTAAWKKGTVILDHAGLVHDHEMPDDEVEWSLGGYRRRCKRGAGERLRRCPECSAVHGWAAECPECHRLYEAGDRSIDEVYGELRELRRAPPPGCEGTNAFAARIGVSSCEIVRLKRLGLPSSVDGWVLVSAAIDWISARREAKKAPAGCEQMSDFAARAGITRRTLRLLRLKGLPFTSNGKFIPIEPALEWLKNYASPRIAARSILCPEGYETRDAFRARTGLHDVEYPVRRGLPCSEKGLIDIRAALVWLDERPDKARRAGFETQTAFAARTGYAKISVWRFVKLGLPISADRLIPVDEALRWVEEYRKTHPVRVRRSKEQ